MTASIFVNTLSNYITNDQLAESIFPYLPDQDGEVNVSLWDVRVSMTGYGHWKISVVLELNDEKITLAKTTTNSTAVDTMKQSDDTNENNEKEEAYLSLLDECLRGNEENIMDSCLDAIG